jgi:hypothetical protein
MLDLPAAAAALTCSDLPAAAGAAGAPQLEEAQQRAAEREAAK